MKSFDEYWYAPEHSELRKSCAMGWAMRVWNASRDATLSEPMAWVTADTVDGQTVNGKPRRIWWENNEGVGMPIYAAPQPAEQQPAPDVARRQSRESAMVVLEQGPDGTPAVWCDPEIADLVSALNKAGIRTVASCSGHGHRPGNIVLSDGRELAIARDFDEARKIDAIFPGINGEPPMVDVSALVEALVEARDLVAEWGDYASDYFKEKHGLERDIARLDAVIAAHQQGG